MMTFDEQLASLLAENDALRMALKNRDEEEGGLAGAALVIAVLLGFGLGVLLGINL